MRLDNAPICSIDWHMPIYSIVEHRQSHHQQSAAESGATSLQTHSPLALGEGTPRFQRQRAAALLQHWQSDRNGPHTATAHMVKASVGSSSNVTTALLCNQSVTQHTCTGSAHSCRSVSAAPPL